MSDTPHSATKIMIIRHAEKPAASGAPYGVTSNGDHDAESLIVMGWQRAGALVPFFHPAEGPLQNTEIATPARLFAAGVANHSESKRPEETITPLAERLGLKIDTSYIKGQDKDVAHAAMACTGVALICWEHQEIPKIASHILKDTGITVPSWPGDRFDVVWIFDLNSSTGLYGFTQVPQQLLAGDTDTVIT
ncbi:MAG TPA: hypothetical protein VEZ90_09615 [Blastocatellia bacterium]|nr:hypothetical protein [Blastocatellia bacterium]